MEATAPNLTQPERYGRYVLLEKIGQGGMAEVFRAVASGTSGFQRILVVKRILPELSRDPRFVQMFVDEAKICALVSHPNVVQVYEFGRLADTHFLTMEYVHGRNLSAVMEKLAIAGKLPPPDVICEVARQTCLGLHHAHTMTNGEGKPMGIIHRDVTPANLMVGFNGAVKVLDFGIARAAEEIKETKTQAGAVKGKVAYLAPEQIHQRPFDHRIDIFAMGVVLHECLSGQRLFKATNPLAAMKSILEMPIPPPSSINPGVPKRVDQIVARALARDPELRYATAKAMALDLEAALHELRYFSQRLPNFLRELFKDELGESKDRILPKELATLSALAEDPPSVPTHTSAAQPRRSPSQLSLVTDESENSHETDVLSLQNPAVRGWQWLKGKGRPVWLAVAGAGVAAAVVAFMLVGKTQQPKQQSSARTALVPTAPAAPAPAMQVQISIDSFPQGAHILGPDQKHVGNTPHTVALPRGRDEVLFTLALEGFKATKLTVIPDLDKPLYAKLEEEAVRKVQRKPPSKARRQQVMPLDPFAD